MRRYFWPRNAHNREQNRPPTPLAERPPTRAARAAAAAARRNQASTRGPVQALASDAHREGSAAPARNARDRPIDRWTSAYDRSSGEIVPHDETAPSRGPPGRVVRNSRRPLRMDTSPYATTPTEEALARKQDNGTARSCSALDGGPRASKREDGRMASTHVARVRTLAPILAARHYCTVVFQEKREKNCVTQAQERLIFRAGAAKVARGFGFLN